MTEAAINVRGAIKAFGSHRAVDALDLTVPSGSVFGLLGPNGAGKTTTIRMIMGHLHPTQGEVLTLGADPWEHDEATKRRVAYVSENMALPAWMTPESAIAFCAPLYPDWSTKLATSLLDAFKLRGKGRFSALSKGQKRSLCLLLALSQNAELLVIDEPASGLDTVARRDFLERILDVACQDGRTVFLSSHILTDLERVVDRVTILCRGRLLLEGNLDELKQGARKLHLPRGVAAETLGSAFQVIRHQTDPPGTEAVVLGFNEERFAKLCDEHNCGQGARHFGLNLEDLFVEVAQSDASNQEGT